MLFTPHNDYTWLSKAVINEDGSWHLTCGAGTVAHKKSVKNYASLYEVREQMRPGLIFCAAALVWLRTEDQVKFLLSRNLEDHSYLPGKWQLPCSPIRLGQPPKIAASRALFDNYDFVGAEMDEAQLNEGSMSITLERNGATIAIKGRVLQSNGHVIMVYPMDLEVEDLDTVGVRNRDPDCRRETRLFSRKQVDAMIEKDQLSQASAAILKAVK
ncbi:hypothetical protein [Comamonas thiooxydans]|uniref:hypothetical protein n=1 Tax=Comamonas thiooxydans TaxID=363952 RepID=UPI001184CA1E|nr:hypothetical protein [Comamonas thiooxydans]